MLSSTEDGQNGLGMQLRQIREEKFAKGRLFFMEAISLFTDRYML
jgi:hypothetical protein